MKYIKTYEELKIREVSYQDIADAGFYIELEAGLKEIDGYKQFMYDDTKDDVFYADNPGRGKSRKSGDYISINMPTKKPSNQEIFEYYFIFNEGSDMSNLFNFCEKYKIICSIGKDKGWNIHHEEIKCEIERKYIVMFSDLYKDIKNYNL